MLGFCSFLTAAFSKAVRASPCVELRTEPLSQSHYFLLREDLISPLTGIEHGEQKRKRQESRAKQVTNAQFSPGEAGTGLRSSHTTKLRAAETRVEADQSAGLLLRSQT